MRRLYLLFIICITSCVQLNNESGSENKLKSNNKIDTSTIDAVPYDAEQQIIAVFPFDSAEQWLFKDGNPTDLSTGDLSKVENILKKSIDDYNTDQEKQFQDNILNSSDNSVDKKDFIIDLTRYKRQYIARINSKNEKEVWVNCLCNTWDEDWKKNLILVDDGGNCYFNITINLTTNLSYDLIVNTRL